MTAADKLRELLATRPGQPSLEELVRWWRSGASLVREHLDDLQRTATAVLDLSGKYVECGREIERLRAEVAELVDRMRTDAAARQARLTGCTGHLSHDEYTPCPVHDRW